MIGRLMQPVSVIMAVCNEVVVIRGVVREWAGGVGGHD